MSPSTVLNEGPFQGWDRYPQNLPNSQDLCFAYDLERYREQISNDAKILFVPQDKETTLKVLEFGRTDTTSSRHPQFPNLGAFSNTVLARLITGLSDLEQYLLVSRSTMLWKKSD